MTTLERDPAVSRQVAQRNSGILWVTHGALWFGLICYCWTAWVVSGDFRTNTLGRGHEPSWYVTLMRGWEIFVPKIPSIRITELAKVMAPLLPVKIVGIRPGEKLHEVMCPADDAHQTLAFGDHYVIKPAIQFFSATDYAKNRLEEGGVPVPDGSQYSSDTNDHWLEGEALRQVVEVTRREL